MKKKKEKKSILNNYRESWETIKESRKFIFVIIGIFFLFAIIGFLIPAPNSLLQLISDYIKQILDETAGLSGIQLIAFILFNNLKSSFFGLVLGIILGIFPVLMALFNGYILGFVSHRAAGTEGILVLWRVLPHGIFELPAVFISMGLGLRLGISLLSANKRKEFGQNFYKALMVFLFVVIPLLLIAAIIEGILIILTT